MNLYKSLHIRKFKFKLDFCERKRNTKLRKCEFVKYFGPNKTGPHLAFTKSGNKSYLCKFNETEKTREKQFSIFDSYANL